jgi:hypothetical protein
VIVENTAIVLNKQTKINKRKRRQNLQNAPKLHRLVLEDSCSSEALRVK